MVNVVVCAASDNLPEKVGEYVLRKQDEALARGSVFNLAISGGSLVNVLKTALIDDKKVADKVQWSKWRVYFVDERIVSLTHPDSNYGAFKEAVLDHLPSGVQVQVFPINASLAGKGPEAYEQVAKEYEEILPKKLDTLLLGCGPDGHTCSLFPDAEHAYLVAERQKRVIWCHDSPKPPSDRVTITIPVMDAAGDIAFVATGSSKQPVMHQIFDKKDTKLPTALVNKLFGGKVTWFVDDQAFTKVETKTF
ncbi:6-phosphogluconolactonase SOL3 KNAG_0E00640 [Huiozyma naganishii CBS 8797]|uniref:6-phosphogluconolactonase-like protein n=1 Tax=Huiozyma naganishii (strain ATCC MYA-139 / BCRC 22969 / CBS 8797 / KCTC 17520 / NBRC 10181 / NCYC 3082 / Yp74L-3) TaxID=1071383 RepID=J7RYS7_HUIN7|nr:hypothetical protein KNAG_0E00640 [Kazachstania naganishii CBS 8797]CCK70332.1 hypothetical protein KNAG_0E00640 [Kazachstania naganishii CBS 8797]